jgi:hypothetical protein
MKNVFEDSFEYCLHLALRYRRSSRLHGCNESSSVIKLTREARGEMRSARNNSKEAPGGTLVRSRALVVEFVCALVTVALHGVLLAPTVFGLGHHTQSAPLQMGAPSDGQGGALGTEAMTVVWLDEPASSDDTTEEALARLALTSEQLENNPAKLKLDHYAPVQIVEEEEQETTQDANAKGVDEANAAAMFGRYMGQVTARIERAWIRPRAPVNGRQFQCLVRIEQDRVGMVKEITLQRCNGDTRWQLSVVRAIESASPLPAPPDPTVFTRLLTLELSSEAFELAKSREGFEREGSSGDPPRS